VAKHLVEWRGLIGWMTPKSGGIYQFKTPHGSTMEMGFIYTSEVRPIPKERRREACLLLLSGRAKDQPRYWGT
jgi:hypothetical protein